ncbi:hypothetical protein [Kutzneria sp. 744]|uniref:hypothetical protein n=1 Tax=Kutzneria sp. (strain 744) TaxID=345341 RepID=UPI0005BAD646|nr:hypothetical protein [Kutzneria sp. 744]
MIQPQRAGDLVGTPQPVHGPPVVLVTATARLQHDLGDLLHVFEAGQQGAEQVAAGLLLRCVAGDLCDHDGPGQRQRGQGVGDLDPTFGSLRYPIG